MKKIPKDLKIGLLIIILIGCTWLVFIKNFAFGPGSADYTYKIANDCELIRTSAHAVSISCEAMGVAPEVIQIGWNDNYLLAATHPIIDFPNYYSDPDESITYWWILDFKNRREYGPLKSEKEFNNKKISLGVSNIDLLTVDQAKAKGSWLDGDFKN